MLHNEFDPVITLFFAQEINPVKVCVVLYSRGLSRALRQPGRKLSE